MDLTKYQEEDIKVFHSLWEETKRLHTIDNENHPLESELRKRHPMKSYLYDEIKEFLSEEGLIWGQMVQPLILLPSERGMDFVVIEAYQSQIAEKESELERQSIQDKLNRTQLEDILKARKSARTANIVAISSVIIALVALLKSFG